MSAIVLGYTRGCARVGVLSLLSTLVLCAQGTGEITGTVTDPSGAAVSGAKIVVTNTATSAERVVTSNETGNYDLPALPPGNYDLKAAFAGFRRAERKGVGLHFRQLARLDLTRRLGQGTPPDSVAAE